MMKKLALVLAVLFVLGAMFGCAPKASTGDTTTPPANSGDTGAEQPATPAENPARTDLNVSTTSGIGSLDPHLYTSANDGRFIENLYDVLVRKVYTDDANGNPVISFEPALAESFEVNADATEYIFHLRSGVKFHNGEVLKASDVAYSYKRAIDGPLTSAFVAGIGEVVAVDDLTVKMTLLAPSPAFLDNVDMIRVVNEKFTEENGAKMNEVACGTGPYTLTESVPEQKYVFTAFPDYYMGEARVKTLNYKVIPDATTAVTAFEAGELDYVLIASEDWDSINGSGEYTTFKYASPTVLYCVYNVEKAPFNDVKVRQAINYALDRESINLMIVGGTYVEAYEVACPGLITGAAQVDNRYLYDVEKAKALLAEAGYPNGIETPMTIKTMGASPFDKLAVALQANLAEVGITVEVEVLEQNAYMTLLATGDFDFGVMGITLPEDYSSYNMLFTTPFINAVNFSRWSDPALDELFTKASMEYNEAARNDLYKQIANNVNDNAVLAPVLYMSRMWAMNKDLAVDFSAMNERMYDMSWTK